MPVIDLKDYLGMPQQAPTQPVFQSTTQSLDPMALRAYDPYSNEAMLANVEGRQRLAGLQRLAPAIQAQQAQLAYDKIGEEARVLRQKQEVEAQVQRATDELLGGALNPESTDFNQQATQFYGRNQLAFLDPRMREAMSFLQKQNQDYTTRQNALQRAEMKTAQQMFKAQQDEINRIDELRIDAIDSGAPRELVLAAKSPYEIASLKAQYGGRTEKDIRGQMMEKDLGLLASEMKRLEDLGEDAVTDEAGKTTYTPRYQSLMDEATKLQGELRGFYQSKYRTPSVPTAPTAGVGDTTKTPPSAPLADTMAKLSRGAKPVGGGAPVIPDLTSEERVKDIQSNKTDPVFLIAAINSPQRDEKSKDVAFEYLKELQKDPEKLQFSYGNPSDIQEAKKEIQKTIEVYPALKEASRAWTIEKQNLEKMVEEFAKANSVTTSLMKTWLKNNRPIGLKFDPTGQAPARDISTREAFDTFLRENSNMSLSDDAPVLTKVAQKYPKRIQDLGLDRWFGLKMGEVLDAYLSEGNIKSATPAQ